MDSSPTLTCDGPVDKGSNPQKRLSTDSYSSMGLSDFSPRSGAEACSAVEEPRMIDDMLVGRFSIMNVTSDGVHDDFSSSLHLLKRGPDALTIEGSPMNPIRTAKRLDLNPTPSRAIREYGGSIPIHVADEAYSVGGSASAYSRPKGRPYDKLLVICSSSDEHDTGDHQENALRTTLLCGAEGCLRRPELQGSISFIDADLLSPPPLADLLRVHEYSYLHHLEQKSLSNSSADVAVPSFYAPAGYLDVDTPLRALSLAAAKRFCGAAMLAVDKIMSTSPPHTHPSEQTIGAETEIGGGGGGCRAAFVVGRPPGHHAGPRGCVPSDSFWMRPDMMSSGFCLLNTVAVAAAYARYQYGRVAWLADAQHPLVGEQKPQRKPLSPPRIAIVDMDVHHGNGTEAIVRNLTPHREYMPLPSSWAPAAYESYKPWLDETDQRDVLFSSIHLYAGAEESQQSPSSSSSSSSGAGGVGAEESSTIGGVINITLTPIGPGPWDQKLRSKLTTAQKEGFCSQASCEFREKVSRMLLPRLVEFKPDLLFISAGFDALHDDMYHFLSEHDVHWLTDQLRSVTASGGGRGVISVLEGGYSLSSPVPMPKIKSTRGNQSKSSSSSSSNQDADSLAKGEADRATWMQSKSCASFENWSFAQRAGDGGLVKG